MNEATGRAAAVFRAARPEDCDAAVPLIYSSGPLAFDFVFDAGQPGGAQAFLRHAFRHGGGEFGYRNHVVGEVDGCLCAAGAAFDGGAVLGFTLAAARQILGFYGPWRAAGVIARGLRTEAVIRPPRGAAEYYVCHLGVEPERRGQGIGEQLIGRLLAAAVRGRHRFATLDVAVTNPRAEALYARLGFRTTERRPSTLANARGRVPDHHRMVRALD